MTINRTTLLDLPLPVTGTESGTWGDITNNGLSQYVDIAVAGMNALTGVDFTAGALTLSNSQGDSGGTNIAAGSAQYATIKTSSLAANSTITAPSSNRSYRIVNADSTYNLTIKASGQTGVTFLPGTTGLVAFNGTDYEVVGVVGAASATDNAIPKFDGTTGQIIQNTGVTIDDSNNVSGVAQLNATTADLTNIEVTNIKAKDGTAAGSIADSTGIVTLASSVLTTTDINGGTIDGTAIGGASAAAGAFTTLNTSGAVVFNDAGADVDFRVEGDTNANLLFVDAGNDRVGIGTNAPATFVELRTASANPTLTLTRTTTVPPTTLGESPYISLVDFVGSATGQRQEINFGYKQLGTATYQPALIGYVQTSGGGNTLGDLYFATRAVTTDTAPSERMRIDSAGNVGIGTSSPGFPLSVHTPVSVGNIVDAAFFTQNNTSNPTTGAGSRILIGSVTASNRAAAIEAAVSSGLNGHHLAFLTNAAGAAPTEKMRIDSAGNVGIGTTSPAANTRLHVNPGTGNNGLYRFDYGAGATSDGFFRITTESSVHTLQAVKSGGGVPLAFEANSAEAMRIDTSGNLLVGTTSLVSGVERLCVVNPSGSGDWNSVFSNPGASPFGIWIRYSAASPNGTGNRFIDCNDSTALRFQVRSNGGIANYTANDVNLSDRREKTNFAPAKSYLQTICAIPVQTFNYIDQNHEEDPGLTLGVVAQDVQAIAPELVMESNWGNKEEPKMRLSIYQTDLQYALMKSIQELKAELDTVKAELATLKGN
jgi:hypothetical protein